MQGGERAAAFPGAPASRRFAHKARDDEEAYGTPASRER